MPVGGQLCGLIGYGNGYGNGYGAGYLIPSTIAISADDYKRPIKAICARAVGLVGYYCAYIFPNDQSKSIAPERLVL